MRITAVVFGVSAVVVAGSALLTYTAGERVIRLRQQEQKRRQALVALGEMFSTVQAAETGQRGFIITRYEKYLAPFRTAQERVPAVSQRFREQALGTIPEPDSAELDQANPVREWC